MALTFNPINLVFALLNAYICSTYTPPPWSHGSLYMVGALMQEKVVRNLYQCENLCRVTRPCRSAEYGFETKLCSLYRNAPEDTDIIRSRTQVYFHENTGDTQIKCRFHTCPDGRVCAANGKLTLCLLGGISCGPVPTLADGQASSNDRNYGAVITYSCNQGYSFQGSNQMARCSEDGSWVGLQGSCNIIDCGTPPDVENAESTYSGTTYGTTVTYTCRTGYVCTGTSLNVTCRETGWSSLDGACVIVNCGTPDGLSNAEVTYEAMTYAATATYSCILGYEFVGGNPTSTCTESGSWGAIDGNCTIITCNPPPELSNAEVTYSTISYGSLATYTCLIGYKFEGDNPNTTCTESASWSTLNGTCTLISCGEPPDIVNATVTYQNMTYGSLATYSCIDGYMLLGGTTDVNCTESGTWANQSGACYRYIGCYTDNWRRLFDDGKSIPEMTLISCFESCQNYIYAGAQNKGECYCGNELDENSYPKVSETECSSPCSGDSSQICGGTWRSSVFRL